MTNALCPRDQRPIGDTGYLCEREPAQLAERLAGTPPKDPRKPDGTEWVSVDEMLAELETTVARLDEMERLGTSRPAVEPWTAPNGVVTITPAWLRSGDHGALRPSVMPFSWDAAAARDAVVNTLTTWARHCAETRGIEVEGTAAMWLIGQLDWLRHRQEGPEAYDELHWTIGLLRRTVDVPPEREYAGRCGCGLKLFRVTGSSLIRCVGCRTDYPLEEYRALMLDQLGHKALTAADLALLAVTLGLGVRDGVRNLIKVWRQRGVVNPVAVREDGAPTYLVREVMIRLMPKETVA